MTPSEKQEQIRQLEMAVYEAHEHAHRMYEMVASTCRTPERVDVVIAAQARLARAKQALEIAIR